ncbi:MAG: PepSY-associated TM helix domain-containing protein [Elusimicrobiota bacterium]
MGRKNNSPRLLFKSVHNVLGLASAVFLLALLATGVMLNHPGALVPGSAGQRFCVAADPADPRRLYRGTASSLDRSDDGGASWEEVPMLFPAQEVVGVAFHPRDAKTIYALQRWHGPLRSIDGGTVWEAVPLDFDPQESGVELLSLAVSAGGELFLETSAGLLRRPSEGAWAPVDFDPARKNWPRLIRALHSGHFFGPWFVKVYDAAAFALLFLIVTGIVLWRIKSA